LPIATLSDQLYAGESLLRFHGLSYRYTHRTVYLLARKSPEEESSSRDLGSGASMCAISGGKSGEHPRFTALDGLPMGSRPGQLDPALALYLAEQGANERQRSNASLQRMRFEGSIRN
jgi:acetate kinase